VGIEEALMGPALRVHERLYVATDGRVGHRMLGVPTLLLRTTGRRSGATRTNGLVYARDGDEYLVVASNGGADKAPGWLFNVKSNTDVEVQIGRDRLRGTARVVERGDPDFDRQWRIVNENNGDRYDAYQEKTSRQIAIVAIRAR
jgi:deazaflavin-dependent oxidoreductase (nitroreductase family)